MGSPVMFNRTSTSDRTLTRDLLARSACTHQPVRP